MDLAFSYNLSRFLFLFIEIVSTFLKSVNSIFSQGPVSGPLDRLDEFLNQGQFLIHWGTHEQMSHFICSGMTRIRYINFIMQQGYWINMLKINQLLLLSSSIFCNPTQIYFYGSKLILGSNAIFFNSKKLTQHPRCSHCMR